MVQESIENKHGMADSTDANELPNGGGSHHVESHSKGGSRSRRARSNGESASLDNRYKEAVSKLSFCVIGHQY